MKQECREPVDVCVFVWERPRARKYVCLCAHVLLHSLEKVYKLRH